MAYKKTDFRKYILLYGIVWSKLVFFIVSTILFYELFSATVIHDSEYEQVIAERYLFAPFVNDSTGWSVLNNIYSVWQAIALPQYHSQASAGVWLLAQNLDYVTFNMYWMPLTSNAVSHDENCAQVRTTALIAANQVQIILCDLSNATTCRVVRTVVFPAIMMNITKINAGLFVTDLGIDGWLYIASDSGLHGLDLFTYTIFPFLNQINSSVSSLAWSSRRKTVFAGTQMKLWIQSYDNISDQWRFEHVNGLIDASITSLVYSDIQDKLWIGQNTGITLLSPIILPSGRVYWYFSRLAGKISNPGSDIGHLPFANITTLSVSHSTSLDGRVWLGAIHGLMRFDINATDIDAWRVFNSPRYMPSRQSIVNIASLAVLSQDREAPANLGSTAVAVKSRGLAVIRFEMWTLAKKANYFQKWFDSPSRYVKYGLVCGCTMSSWGDIRTCVKEPCDSDGLWTAIYLASQVFRYATTHDLQVKKEAWKYFETLELLNKVTGIPGYPSRSVANRTDFPPRSRWYPSPIYSEIQFYGDKSSDEIVGHQFVHPLVHDLLAENDDERQRAYILIVNITTHILTHDWYLIGENHNHTRWGIWNPIQINNDSYYQESRGLNSLQIFAFLLQTYAYTGDERFLDGVNLLIQSYQYDINLINQKMIAVCDNNFSDDELAYLSYFNLFYAFQTIISSTVLSETQKNRAQNIIDHLLPFKRIGLDLSHKYKVMEKSPFYNFIYCYVSEQVNLTREIILNEDYHASFDCDSLSIDSIWYLRRWPLDLIDWPQFNSDLLDISMNKPASQCQNEFQSLDLIPPDERSSHRWNSAIYDVDDGDGFNALDSSSFLIGYWGMRYFNLLEF
ncbi:unnamed protein product [Rotaria socialis]|uniref:Uncharacterized protein n=1 Tax=Rotaria socialis TaxID=392032 RepID=A0A817UC42_9BILA|nr:unnamed protein product [Rotaria socialis]CAF3555421.1 unnamed protein product [Rotaria socialis]